MDAMTYTTVRANLASTMDRVCNDHEALIITRNGEQAVVMLSLEDFKAPALCGCTTEHGQRDGAETGQVKLLFADEAWEDYLYWQKQDRRMVERINKLIEETQREPYTGIGKPEALKHALSGYWSRRITDEHRMVYRIEGKALLIAQLRFHY
jgi:toxin YoeB